MSAPPTIYLDHAATTPTESEVLARMGAFASEFPGNPSSVHAWGRKARAALDSTRAELAELAGGRPENLVFTASGSEANSLVLQGVLARRQRQPSHIVVSAIEHDSILNAARYLSHRNDWISVSEVGADAQGRVSVEAVAAAIRPETCLVCLMHANNETGVIQPVAEVAGVVRAAGALLHVDAVQSFTKVPGVDLEHLGCDSLSIAAHKFYGPKGIGALVLRGGVKIDPIIFGGSQERDRRAGTENLPAAAGMALAAKLASAKLSDEHSRLLELENVFLTALRASALFLEINGATDDKLRGVLNLSIRGCHHDDLVVGMDLVGYAISAGSACSSGVIEPSHVLKAMGLPDWRVQSAIRVSFGRSNTIEDARNAADALIRLCQRLQHEIPAEEAL